MNNNRLWTKKAEEALKELWNCSEISNEQIQEVFPNRSWDAICKKASRLDLAPRSEIMDEVNWKLYNKLYNEVIEG